VLLESGYGLVKSGASAGPRVVFFGLFGIGNFGNDASLEAAVAASRRLLPQVPLMVVCGDPEIVGRRFEMEAISMFPSRANGRLRASRGLNRILYVLFERIPAEPAAWLRAFRILGRGDHLVVPGTGILDDFGTAPTSVPLALVRWCVAARLRRCRISFLSVGAGPIHNDHSRRLLTLAARLAGYRSFRDRGSRDFMTDLGLDTRDDPVTPDLAFSLAKPTSGRAHAGDAALTVGVGVMNYRGWLNRHGDDIYRVYVERMTDFVEWLLHSGYHVHLFTGDIIDGRSVRDVHANVVQRNGNVRGRLGLDTEPADSMELLLRQISNVDVVVATRFHTVIGAALCRRPVVAVGYEAKFDLLMEALGLGGYCQRIETLDVERLKRQFSDLVAEAEEATERLSLIDSAYRAALEAQYEQVLLAAR
jgi:polysaccharide pyruvyl transferase WcaK-like protein